MKKRFTITIVFFFICILPFAFGAGRLKTYTTKVNFFNIGTGGVTGIYYPSGGAISRVINMKRNEYGIRCTVESTPGSVYNIDMVISGNLDFAVVQSDRQYQAVKGLAEWADKGKQEKLRSVFSVHPEAVTLLATVKSGIKTVTDLKGKRVNIGNIGSGPRQNSIDVLDAFGIDYKKDLIAFNEKAPDAPGLLLDGKIDAMFYTVGHPSAAFKEATAGAIKAKFIPINGAEIDELIKKYPYYYKCSIPIKFYNRAENDSDIPTFGVKGTLVTSVTMPDDVVYAITKEIFENMDYFKSLHPSFDVLTKQNMLDGLTAPLHSGAIKYYRQVGLMKN